MNSILFGLWFFIPAGVANVTPIFAAKIPILKNFSYPLDGYLKMNNIRLLGNHKTIRGFLVGIFCAVVMSFLQQLIFQKYRYLFPFIPNYYGWVDPLPLGLLLGSGALIGDGVKSFFKRRIAIDSGKSWFFADQLDYIIGGIIFSLFYIVLPIQVYGVIILEWFVIHLLSSAIGFLIRLKNAPI